ncbi:MAG: HAD family hydrolase [Lachnospiraceae bacterium]|nr:HAD family hydrolase [Lachnospiraceae bacterium]
MNKKLIFFDIDGTLWGHDRIVPESTKEGIKKAQKNGHICMINTGRCRSFVRDRDLLGIGFDGIITGCSTMIEYNGETLFYHVIDNDVIEYAINTSRSFSFRPILEGRYNLYYDDDEFGRDPFGIFIREEMGDDVLPIEENWNKWEVSKMSCAVDDGHIEECYEKLKDNFDFMVHNSSVIELVPKGFHKGVGVKKACELLNIPIEDTVCFGDSANDIEMFEAVNTGVAMGNSADVIKDMASFVTTDFDKDGIYLGLEKLGII